MADAKVSALAAVDYSTALADDLLYLARSTPGKSIRADKLLRAILVLAADGSVYYDDATGKLKIRFPGGSTSQQVELSHDGTNGIVESKAGLLRLIAAVGVVQLAGGTLSSVAVPVTLLADVDDWNPGVARNYEVTASGANRTITGMLAGVDGEERRILNAGTTNNVILSNAAAGSAAANRFDISSNATLLPKNVINVRYSVAMGGRWVRN